MSADHLVVLTAVDRGRLATKTVRMVDGGWSITPYDKATWFSVCEIPVGDLVSLGQALAELERDPRAFVIRGEPLLGIDQTRCRRLIYPQIEENGELIPETFKAAPRRSLAVDFDDLATPTWNQDDLARRREAIERDRAERRHHPPKTEDDGEDYDLAGDGDPAPIDPARDWSLICRAAISTLPPEFEGLSCYWQLTSSAGIKPGVRLRLWFWCDRPVSDEEAKRWLTGSPVDRSLYSPVQAHYTAAPIFDPPELDPVPIRGGFYWRHRNVLPVPELPEPEYAAPVVVGERQQVAICDDPRETAIRCLERTDLTNWEREFCAKIARLDTITRKQVETLVRIADPMPARAEAYAHAALRGVETATTGNRHPTLMGVAVRLYSLTDLGLLDPADVTRRLLESAQKPLSAAERLQRCERQGGQPSANEQAIDWARARAKASPDLPEGFRP